MDNKVLLTVSSLGFAFCLGNTGRKVNLHEVQLAYLPICDIAPSEYPRLKRVHNAFVTDSALNAHLQSLIIVSFVEEPIFQQLYFAI